MGESDELGGSDELKESFNIGTTDCVSGCVADRSLYIGLCPAPGSTTLVTTSLCKAQRENRKKLYPIMADGALPNLYRHYSGNNDDDNTSLPSTEKDPDKPPLVVSEIGCDLVGTICCSPSIADYLLTVCC